MILHPWWDRLSGRLEFELDALRRAGIHFRRDDAAFDKRIMRLELVVTTPDGEVPLIATFPDLYPYFRFEILAPTLMLEHHQNPFAKNLCFIGRSTDNWHTNDTLAEFVIDRFPKVLSTARATESELPTAEEEQQAEPFSDYYAYAPGAMILIDSHWCIERTVKSGTFIVATRGPQGPPPKHAVFGAISRILDDQGATLAEADKILLRAFPGDELFGRWVRLAEPIFEESQPAIFREVMSQDPRPKRLPQNRVSKGQLEIYGILFPEEVAWRASGFGWTFVCQYRHPHIKDKLAWKKRTKKSR